MNKCTLVILTAVLLYGEGGAQQNIRFEHLTVDQGLAHSAVNSILQDRQGFLWFGTQEGLQRFDGHSLKLFRHIPGDTTSLDDNFIYSISEDRNGALRIGTLQSYTSVLNRYDPVNETFTRDPTRQVDLTNAFQSAMNAAYTDPSGVVLSGVIGGGLVRLDPKTKKTTTFRRNPSDPRSIADDRVYYVYGDRSGQIWVATHEGLDRLDPATGSFFNFKHRDGDPHSLSDNWVWPIYEDNSGTLWIGTVRGGLNKFDRATETFTSYRHSAADPASLSDDYVLSIFQDRSGPYFYRKFVGGRELTR